MPRNLKTLFINPPWYRLQGLISTYPPMGASYIAAVLEENGYESVIWNADYSEARVERISAGSHSRDDAEMTKSFEKYKNILNGLTHPIWKEVEETIRRVNPGIVGVTVNTSALKSAANIALIAKKVNPDIKVVFGGPHPTILPEETIRTANVDYVIIGEGETSFLGLVNAISAGKTDLGGIPGLTYILNGAVSTNPRAANYENPDLLPMPAKHLYLDRHKLPADVFSPIFTSRGCPFSCIYCGSFNIHGRKPRFRSPEKVIQELKVIRNDFNCYNIVFCDDTFGVNLKHTNAILDAIIDSRLDITWVCQTRGETLTEELVKKMKRAGCHQVSIGVETGSPRIRELIKKANKIEDILSAAALVKKYNMQLATFFMFGFPTETREDIDHTISLMKKLDPEFALCNIVTPAPGTELLEMAKSAHLISSAGVGMDWTNFYHQSPEMFMSDKFSEKEKLIIIREVQGIFDSHNRKKVWKVFFKWFFLYLNVFIKNKIYRNPRYMLSLLRNLV